MRWCLPRKESTPQNPRVTLRSGLIFTNPHVLSDSGPIRFVPTRELRKQGFIPDTGRGLH
jgi:hypothetical protein